MSMSESARFLSWAQFVLEVSFILFSLVRQRLAHRDNPNDVIAGLRECDDDHDWIEKADAEPPVLAVILAIIEGNEDRQ